MVYRLAFGKGTQGPAEDLGAGERIEALTSVLGHYADPDLLGDPDGFFQSPRRVQPKLRFVANEDGTTVQDAVWPSSYEPFSSEVAPEYLSRRRNHSAHARLFQRAGRRPTMILIHGYLGGVHRIEQRFWPIRWLLERGMDVALFVLPFHGPRCEPGRRPPFPNSDPRVTIEGFRQAIFDLSNLGDWLIDRGAPALALMGMSLGGYTTALAASTMRNLHCAIPFIPLASIPDFARDRRRLIGTEAEQRMQYQLLDEVYRVVSPLSRPRTVPHAMVIGGEVDGITPTGHAQKLAEHLEAPLELFAGGHILQFGRGRSFRRLGSVLDGAGLFGSRA